MFVSRSSLRRLANPWLLLAAILVVHALANYLWVSADRTLRAFDMGPHIEYQANAHAVVADEGLAGVLRVARGDGEQVWPSAGYLPLVALSLPFGAGLTQIRMFTLLYLALLMVALYLLGRRVHSSRAGLLAVALVTLYPQVYGESRQVGIDLPGAACATLAIYLMLCTERLSHLWRTVGLGAACGAGLLVCPRIALFLVPSAVFLLGVSLVAPRGTARIRVLLHASLGLAAAGGISACWWWGRLASMARSLGEHQEGLGGGLGSESSVLYYLKVFPWSFSFYLVLMGALALGLLVRRRSSGGLFDPDRLLLVLVWFVSGLVVLCLLEVHYLRYLLPFVPAVALLTAVGLCAVSPRSLQRLLTGLALGVAVISWLMDSFAGQVDHGWPGVDKATQTASLVSDHEVTSGPPSRNPVVVLSEEVGRALSGWHGDTGYDVLLRIEQARWSDVWHIRPMLSTSLPGLMITRTSFQAYDHEKVQPYLRIWGSNIARSVKPPRHCYHMVFEPCEREGCNGYTPPREAGVVMKGVYARTVERVRVTLWRRSRCSGAPGSAR